MGISSFVEIVLMLAVCISIALIACSIIAIVFVANKNTWEKPDNPAENK